MPAAPADSDLPAILGGRAWLGGEEAPWPPADDDVADTLRRMAIDGSWGHYHGPHGERLSAALRQRYDCEHVLLCSSGRAAIELALRGLSIGDGDEVALSAYDFRSNFSDIQLVGATPVLCDIRADDAQLDAGQVAAALGTNIRCII